MASKRLKIIIMSLEKQGCVVREVKGGWLVRPPSKDAEQFTIHGTESDHRAELNTRARVKRARLTWPFDGK